MVVKGVKVYTLRSVSNRATRITDIRQVRCTSLATSAKNV